MTGTQIPPATAQPPEIEVMGALCSLLIHDFANHLSVINGNAQCAQMFINDPQRASAALASIVQAGETAASLLTKCGELRRCMGSGVRPGDVSLLTGVLADGGNRCPGWTVNVPSPLTTGQVALPLPWIAFTVFEFVRETREERGTIWLAVKTAPKTPGPSPTSPVNLLGGQFLEIRLVWRSSKPFPFDDIRSKHLNLNLLAACELVKIVGGRTVCGTLWPTEQEVTVCIPTVGGGQ